MPLQPEEIAAVQTALTGPAPAWDPNWKITSAMLETILKQQNVILQLASDLAIVDSGRAQTRSMLLATLNRTLIAAGAVVPPPIPAAEADRVAAEIDEAIKARRDGATVLSVASKVLKFVGTVM